jgi:S-phase kinase-associated protein 1
MEVVTLMSNDGNSFEVSTSWATKLNTVKNVMDDVGIDQPIPVREVSGKTLEKVVSFLRYEDEKSTKEKVNEFLASMTQSDLFETILAANYLDYPTLLDATCSRVSDMIRGKTPAEIRTTFGIKNDFTPEEEQQVIQENEWVEEK